MFTAAKEKDAARSEGLKVEEVMSLLVFRVQFSGRGRGL
jgi:hypothetical protein